MRPTGKNMNKNYKNTGFVTGYSRACGCSPMPPQTDGKGCGMALAMAYVPRQTFGNLYTPEQALQKGTLFAALDLPYHKGGRTV